MLSNLDVYAYAYMYVKTINCNRKDHKEENKWKGGMV